MSTFAMKYKYVDCFIPWQSDGQVQGTLENLKAEPQVQSINLLRDEGPGNTQTIKRMAETATAPYTLLYCKYDTLQFGYHALDRMLTIAEDSGALMLYSDHYQVKSGEAEPLRLIDYQLGSVRDDFQMGSVLLLRPEVLKEYVAQENLHPYLYAALYDLRLFISLKQLPLHIDEFLYTEVEHDTRLSGEKQFDYVDPRNRARQVEMERACTRHLRALNAYLHGDEYDDVKLPIAWSARRDADALNPEDGFAVEASVIIPVRNRERTIEDAIRSALSQETSFPFNVIVIDNHSTDGTTEIIGRMKNEELRMKNEEFAAALTPNGNSDSSLFTLHSSLEAPFRYPGPKPQTLEQAILMMADAVEAASRSLPEYTEESISAMVEKIVGSQVADGSFDECAITFREIAEAKEVLSARLRTVYHTRIQYPE